MDDTPSVISGNIQLSKDMKITPLAAESLGVRSLAVHVQTDDTSILIDPSVALGFRDNRHPHPEEYQLLSSIRKKIDLVAQSTDLIVISHFHHDHFMPFFQNYAYFWSSREDASSLYRGRRIYCKDIRLHINYSQQRRGYNFVRSVRKVAEEVVYADGRALKIGQTLLRFSPAVPHGEEGTKLGWVIMTAIRCGDFMMVHASDVQGPMVKSTAEWIAGQNPDVLVLAGPPTYLSPEKVKPDVLEKAAENLGWLAEQIPMIIVDHHLLRDQNWSNWLNPIQRFASDRGHQILTITEVLGLSENLLEANRVDLYHQKPIDSAFEDWVKKIRESRIKIPPPLD